ncbi:MAG TPA: hypothetical protein VIK55_08335 [Paludibacter sp.]
MKTLIIFISLLSITSLLLIGCCGNSNKKESNQVESSTFNEQVQAPSKADRLISDQRPKFKIIRATAVEYIDKEISIYGYCSLSQYYFGGYEDSNKTHYCINIEDNEGISLTVYFEKSKNKELFNLLSESDRVPLKLKIVNLSDRFHPILPQLFEGLSWKMIK